jgi:uncharacterized membrane protein
VLASDGPASSFRAFGWGLTALTLENQVRDTPDVDLRYHAGRLLHLPIALRPGVHDARKGSLVTNFCGTKMSAAEENIRLAFRISLFIKGVFALVEIAGGALAYFISQEFLVSVITAITQDELVEDPNDFVANHLLHLAQQFSIGTQYFTAIYLLSHGILKLFLIARLLRERLWYYPLAIIVFTLFIVYQLYRFSFTLPSGCW